jgi:hypothetical protein
MEEGVMIMKKTNPILMLTAVFVVIFVAACSTPATPAPQVVEPAVEQPAQQQPAAPADTAAPVESAPTDAPASSGGTFEFPDTIASETYCVTKIPYQNLLLDQGVTFEPQDPKGELKCTDSGTEVDGKNVITCTAKELWTYDLKLTDANGASTVIKVNMGACPSG